MDPGKFFTSIQNSFAALLLFDRCHVFIANSLKKSLISMCISFNITD